MFLLCFRTKKDILVKNFFKLESRNFISIQYIIYITKSLNKSIGACFRFRSNCEIKNQFKVFPSRLIRLSGQTKLYISSKYENVLSLFSCNKKWSKVNFLFLEKKTLKINLHMSDIRDRLQSIKTFLILGTNRLFL